MSKVQSAEEKKLSPAVVIGGVLLFIVLVFAYKFFVSDATIRLISPVERAALSASDLNFKWTCNRKDAQLVLEVYDGAELILRQFVDQDSYTPQDEQKALFEADHLYYWRVIPNPDVKQKYNFNYESQPFYITSALAKVEEEVKEEAKPEEKVIEEPQQQKAPERPYDPYSTAVPSEGLF